jgi:hypothetical protein
MGLLILTVDRQNEVLVPYLGSVPSLPALFQSNVKALRVQVVDPTGNPMNPYSLVDVSKYGLRASVGDTPTGAAGGPTPLALQDTFFWNSKGFYFEADLLLNTTAVDAFLGPLPARQAYFELNLTLGGNRITILQTTFTLKAVVDELTAIAPTPTDQYLTKAECLALFAKLVGDLGQRIVLRSANGLYGRELGCNDDGSAADNIIQNP